MFKGKLHQIQYLRIMQTNNKSYFPCKYSNSRIYTHTSYRTASPPLSLSIVRFQFLSVYLSRLNFYAKSLHIHIKCDNIYFHFGNVLGKTSVLSHLE